MNTSSSKANPYTLMFGKLPNQFISRTSQADLITGTFMADPPNQQVYIITGIHGSGKNVLLTEAARFFRKQKDWIVIDLSSEDDMIQSLASQLTSDTTLSRLFRSAKINLSFLGLGIELQGESPVTSLQTALTRMFESLKKNHKKVLITVDEAANNTYMRKFASLFQILARQDLPVFLLMTGLYEQIYELQNEKSLTFLYRAPKIHLSPLSVNTMAANYKKNLPLDIDSALELARLTKGYSFAFQVFGYYVYQEKAFNEEAVTLAQQYLEENAYEKIWSELSQKDREVTYAIAQSKDGKIQNIRSVLKMDSFQFTPYRTRLIRKGIINGDTHGYVYFTLPLFEKYVLANYGLYY